MRLAAPLCVAVSVFALSAASAAGPARPSIGFKRPPEGTYAVGANLILAGGVANLSDTDVQLRTYHVRGDGGLVPLGGADVPLGPDGTFECDLKPASPGWRPGTLRVVAAIEAMPHVRVSHDVTIAAPDRPQEEWVEREPTRSDLVIDFDRRVTGAEVVRGQTFLVRASTRLDPPPTVVFSLVRTDHPRGEVIYDEWGSGYPMRGDGRRWLEAEFTAPAKVGRYELRATVRGEAEPVRVPLHIVAPVAVNPTEGDGRGVAARHAARPQDTEA